MRGWGVRLVSVGFWLAVWGFSWLIWCFLLVIRFGLGLGLVGLRVCVAVW